MIATHDTLGDRRLKFLIISLNYAPELVGIAVYSAGLAEALAVKGHTVAVVGGVPYYPSWIVPPEYRKRWLYRNSESGVDVTRVAHYVPRQPSGPARIFHHVSFAISCLVPALRRSAELKPDVVLTIAPSLVAAPVGKLAAMISGGKSWLHIQDFEVEAAVATRLLKEDSSLTKVAFWFESFVLSKFDRLSSISPAMCEKLKSKIGVVGKVVEFRNWADTSNIIASRLASSYRSEWNIASKYVVLYSGNIANKQGIEIVVEAARRLGHRRDLTFVVCGNGPNRENLEAQASGLENIQFHDLQPRERLNDLLSLADVHLLPQLSSAADLVLPSKLANMLASGRPIVATAHKGTGLAMEVEGCGIVVPPEDGTAFSNAIAALLDDQPMRERFAVEASARAIQRWQKDSIIGDFENKIAGLI